MSNIKLYTTLIKRTGIGTLYNYFKMKNIENYQFIRNNHDELKPYENQFGRKLTRIDAIVISPLTQSEITKIIDSCYENKKLQSYQANANKERLKYYHENYGKNTNTAAKKSNTNRTSPTKRNWF